MKVFLSKLFLTFLTVQVCLAEDQKPPAPVTAIGDVLQLTRGVDMFDGTRRQINRFVTDLTNHGNRAQDVLRDLSAKAAQARNDFSVGSTEATSAIWTALQNIINGFIDAAAVLPQALWTCVDNELERAGAIVNRTLAEGFACLSNSLGAVVTLVTTGTDIATRAVNLGTTIASQTLNCGVSNILNFSQVGICLNRIVLANQLTVNTLIGQLIGLVATALTNIVSVPIGVGVCVASVAASAAIESAALVTDMVACKINTGTQIIGQG